MNVLLTCDDGCDSQGFTALQEVAKRLKLRATCIAPAENMSGIGSCRTLKTLLVKQVFPGFLEVSGTPVDCVNLALSPKARRAFKLPKFDMVLSGINWGANVGHETLECSGTYAAARYAALHGVRAMAISQDVRSGSKFQMGLATAAVKMFMDSKGWKANQDGKFICPVLNVNLPAKPSGRSWERVRQYCVLDSLGGYHGDWRRLDDVGRGWMRFSWAQKWKQGERGFMTDVSLLDAGRVSIIGCWMQICR